ncbi:hypothetical protein H4S08_000207 [Coemansia sp. RSA 1365]|nr:hypothetical protein H4S08_000207 [Coemansia sp. RSA 1365]
MARPEQTTTTGHKLQGRLGGLGSTSPFSQPPQGPGTPPFLQGAGRHEKTAVGRSGVFAEYGAGEYYRRHSMDMAAATGRHPLAQHQGVFLGRGTKRAAETAMDSGGSSSESEDSVVRGGVATAEKPYACDQCELTFSRQHNLKSHALTHSTERPFSCGVCQTPFRRQHDLKRHMKLHTGEKPYKCTNCGRSFARLDALNRHMRAENFHACSQAAKKARTDEKGFVEHRRASHNPSVSVAPWSHWTHRPSIAADEAMLRRMHDRFGGPPPPPYPPRSAAAAPPPGTYVSEPRGYAHPQAPVPPQPTHYSSAPASAGSSASGASHLPPPTALRAVHGGKPALTPPGHSESVRFAPIRGSPVDRPPWQQQQPGTPGAARSVQAPPPPPLRLPPIELVPPRRHSLAVTSQLERYRARDTTPPAQETTGDAHGTARGAAATPITTGAVAQYGRKPATPQPMAPVPEEREIAAAEARRSSIIALTNPQTEDDVRAENTELKRRLDEMEARYLREVERLNAAVRGLEIEKTLLKEMLLEKGASLPGSPAHHRAGAQAHSPAPHSAPGR